MSDTDLEREGDIAADFLEELLDIADLDGDIDIDVDGDRAALEIIGGDLGHLVGRDGEVLDALQELTRLAVYRETGQRSRLMLDVAGYRAGRRAEVTSLAAAAVEKVRAGEPSVALDVMTPFERKVAHDVVAEAGLRSESDGTAPHRYVVVYPGVTTTESEARTDVDTGTDTEAAADVVTELTSATGEASGAAEPTVDAGHGSN